MFHIFKVFFLISHAVSDLDVKYIKFPTSLNRGSFLLIYDSSIPTYPTLQRPGRAFRESFVWEKETPDKS